MYRRIALVLLVPLISGCDFFGSVLSSPQQKEQWSVLNPKTGRFVPAPAGFRPGEQIEKSEARPEVSPPQQTPTTQESAAAPAQPTPPEAPQAGVEGQVPQEAPLIPPAHVPNNVPDVSLTMRAAATSKRGS